MLSSVIAFGVIASLFAVIYKVLPHAVLSWRDVWVGALFTAGLFSLGKYAIGLYLGRSAVASSFGAAGSLIALLLWVYYSAQIFFLGAELTRQCALQARETVAAEACMGTHRRGSPAAWQWRQEPASPIPGTGPPQGHP